jgi:hypothetical protein
MIKKRNLYKKTITFTATCPNKDCHAEISEDQYSDIWQNEYSWKELECERCKTKFKVWFEKCDHYETEVI